MIEITGKYSTAKALTDNIEDEALKQIQQLCNQEFTKDSTIRIMPDVHAGKGCVIGLAMEIFDKVVPNLVGVDIGCGVLTIPFRKEKLNLKDIDDFIHNQIPSGFNVYTNQHYTFFDKKNENLYNDLMENNLTKIKNNKYIACLENVKHLCNSLGTLGGGNHFIEINKDNIDNTLYYLTIHTGSRNLGVQVCNYHQNIAIGYCKDKNIPKDLSYLENDLMCDYIQDMLLTQEFAKANRQCIALKIADFLCGEFMLKNAFDTVHNYIDETYTDGYVLRKGCVTATKGKYLIIPINMRDGSLICEGKGNDDFLCTAPHGAGRIMSRGQAKKNISIEDFKNTMQGIYSTCINENTLDESPMVYKSINEIQSNLKELVDIVKIIKPIYNFKAN